jgi:four helix bundle protein
MEDDILTKKAFSFAVRVVKAYQSLCDENLSKQFLRSGTAIATNIMEANGAMSKSDFSEKMSIAYKECLETKYWLSLLKDTGYIDDKVHSEMIAEADELGEILFSVIKTTKMKQGVHKVINR